MGKVRRLIRGLGRRTFLVAAGGTFVALLGLASALLTIMGRHFDLSSSVALICASLILACATHYRKLATSQIAVDDVLERSFFEDPTTRIRCPCDFSLAAAAKRLAADCFSGGVTIGPDVFEQFRGKNPEILACLTSRTGAFLGYFDVIPLADRFAESLLKGQATEEELTHEDVLRIDELARCRFLFISGFAVVDPHTHAGKRNASMLTWALLKYLESYYGEIRPLVFALAATSSGNEILNRFGLDLRSGGEGRRDRYRLYAIVLSTEAIRHRLACLPDWKGICQLDWAPGIRGRDMSGRPSLPETHAWELGGAGP